MRDCERKQAARQTNLLREEADGTCNCMLRCCWCVRDVRMLEVHRPTECFHRQLHCSRQSSAVSAAGQRSGCVHCCRQLFVHQQPSELAPTAVDACRVDAQEQLGHFDCNLQPRRQDQTEGVSNCAVAQLEGRCDSMLDASDEVASHFLMNRCVPGPCT